MNTNNLMGSVPEQPSRLSQIQTGGKNVGLDLEKPIDLSEMQMHYAAFKPIETYLGMKFECVTKLYTQMENGDELEIVIKKTTTKIPDFQ